MNEISYLPVRNERAQNPNNPCIEEKRSKNLTYPDLDVTYNYGMELCIYYHIQQHVAQHCKYDLGLLFFPENPLLNSVLLLCCRSCMWIEVPRIQKPHANLPYCGYILGGIEKFTAHSQCVKKFTMNHMFNLTKKFARTKCLKKCTLVEYQTTVSVTKWRQTAWQLHWIEKQINMWNDYFGTYQSILMVG